MARHTFTILCTMQIVIGLLMFSFGIADRAAIELQCSFLMLPIWIGALAGILGFYSLIVGRQNKRQGFADVDAGSAIKVVSIICVGLSFLAFYMYGSALSYVGLLEAYNYRQELNYPTGAPLPNLPSPLWYNNSDTIQGIFSVVVILCFAEMFVGCWLALIDRNQMVYGSSNQPLRIPVTQCNHVNHPNYYQQPAQQGQQAVQVVLPGVSMNNQQLQPQAAQQNIQPSQVQYINPQQQQTQQGYVVAQGNTNFPSNQVFVPINQVQQPQYVQRSPVFMVASNQSMIPNNQSVFLGNQNMVPSNPNMVPSNQNVVPSNQNVMPGDRMPNNQNMAPSNQNMVPSNRNTVPSSHNPVLASVQSEEAEGGSSDPDQRLIPTQENEWIKMDSDKNKLI